MNCSACLLVAALTFSVRLSAAQTAAPVQTPIDAITFADSREVYVPLRLTGERLGLPVNFDTQKGGVTLGSHAVHIGAQLYDGTSLISLQQLKGEGVQVDADQSVKGWMLKSTTESLPVRLGAKRIVVDIAKQELDAYQGETLVFSSHVSTGRSGKSTPIGSFTIGPIKDKMHLSALYNFAHMPWSVQVNHNIFIHGFATVPTTPASHGCIRLPIPAAKWFFSWVEVGDSVVVTGQWRAPDTQGR